MYTGPGSTVDLIPSINNWCTNVRVNVNRSNELPFITVHTRLYQLAFTITIIVIIIIISFTIIIVIVYTDKTITCVIICQIVIIGVVIHHTVMRAVGVKVFHQ